jgi:uncharacterized protein YbjT (DUF2867 family)
MKTALVFGASGLTGSQLVELLSENPFYTEIIVFNRKRIGYHFPKVREVVADVQNTTEIARMITGDDLFCCIGTTQKKAGTKENFRKIDHGIPLDIGKIAKKNGVKTFLYMSSIGANGHSSNFYLRTKGETEEALKALNFPSLIIVRPSMLMGKRKERRIGESIGKIIIGVLGVFMIGKLKKYRGIYADDVARAMIKLGLNTTGFKIAESDELQSLANSY